MVSDMAMTLEQAREQVGATVSYVPRGEPDAAPERGRITRVSGHYVFVHYFATSPGDTAQATYPADLTLVETIEQATDRAISELLD